MLKQVWKEFITEYRTTLMAAFRIGYYIKIACVERAYFTLNKRRNHVIKESFSISSLRVTQEKLLRIWPFFAKVYHAKNLKSMQNFFLTFSNSRNFTLKISLIFDHVKVCLAIVSPELFQKFPNKAVVVFYRHTRMRKQSFLFKRLICHGH